MRRYRKVLTYGIAIALGAVVVAAGPALAHLAGGQASESSNAPMPRQAAAAKSISPEARPPLGSPASATPAAEALAAPAGQPAAVTVAEADVIRTGSLDIEVGRKDLQKAFDAAGEDAASLGGYVASSTSGSVASTSPSASLVLRVPSASFLQLVDGVGGLGKIESEALQGTDVTGQVIDVAARIANLQAEQLALRQLISRTGSIPEILQVEDQLFAVEQQIEELSAQQSSLANQVTYATLSVELAVVPPPVVKPRPKAPVNAVLHGARAALHNTAASLHGIALAVGEAFPAILLVGVAAGLLALFRRRRAARSPTVPGAPSGAAA
jgi:hypothetical protein